MVEFALAAMTMLLTVFGIIEFGLAAYAYHAVSNAARLGARYAIVRGTTCGYTNCTATQSGIQDYVRGQSPLLQSSSVSVTTTWSGTASDTNACTTSSHDRGCLVSVSVAYPFTFALPFISQSALSLSSTSEMVVSQ